MTIHIENGICYFVFTLVRCIALDQTVMGETCVLVVIIITAKDIVFWVRYMTRLATAFCGMQSKNTNRTFKTMASYFINDVFVWLE